MQKDDRVFVGGSWHRHELTGLVQQAAYLVPRATEVSNQPTTLLNTWHNEPQAFPFPIVHSNVRK